MTVNTMELQPSDKSNQSQVVLRWLLLALIGFAPLLITLLLVCVHLRTSLTDAVPVWSDEISYWHQTLSFRNVGFGSGYYTTNDALPRTIISPFNVHGPWYPMIYGAISWLTGWELYTPALINVTLVGLALFIFGWKARLETRGLVILLLHTLTFWPMVFYLPVAMQESLQIVAAIALGFIFYKLIDQQGATSRLFYWFSLFTVTAVSILRLDWAILALPFFLLTERSNVRGVFAALIKTGLLGIVVLWISNTGAPPSSDSVAILTHNFSTSFTLGLQSAWSYFGFNLWRYLSPVKQPLDIALTIQTLSLIAFFATPFLFRKRVRMQPKQNIENGFHLFNLISIVVACLILYIIATGGDYRVIAHHMTVSLLVLIAFRRYRLILLLIVSNVLVTGYFLNAYDDQVGVKFRTDHAIIESFDEQVRQVITYDPDVPTPWCNTLLFPVTNFHPGLNTVPPGISHTFYWPERLPTMTIHSRYLLLTDNDYQMLEALPDAPMLEQIVETSRGSLYRNLDVVCD